MIDDEYVKILRAHTTSIRQLWIMNQNLQDSVVMLLFEGLMKNRGVLHLNLSNNNLSSKIAKILCKWLRKSPLIGLDVSYNSFGDEGIQELMDAVRNHKSLRLLRIGDNDINLLGKLHKCGDLFFFWGGGCTPF